MAQLLEQHKGQDLSDAYTSLLNPILQPQVWDPGKCMSQEKDGLFTHGCF